MNASRSILIKMINEIPEREIPEIIDFIAFLKSKRENEAFKDLLAVSESSINFWDNDIDNEVWNNV